MPRVPSPRRNFPTSTSGTASIQVVGGARSFLGCWVGPLQKKVFDIFFKCVLFLCFFHLDHFGISWIFSHMLCFSHMFSPMFSHLFPQKFTSFMLKFRLSRLRQEAVEAATGEQVAPSFRPEIRRCNYSKAGIRGK